MDVLSSHKTSYFKEKFAGLTYSTQKIKNLEFEDCVFEKCSFIESTVEACRFIDCSFFQCKISALNPLNSKINTPFFRDSKVMGVDWTKAKNIQEVRFERCDISYSNFSFLKLHNLKLLECIAHEVSFSEADLTGSVFTKTDFAQSIFSHTNMEQTDFRNAINYGIDFNFNNLKKAKFSLPEAASLLKSLDIILEV